VRTAAPLRATALNCTLKTGAETSSTDVLLDELLDQLRALQVDGARRQRGRRAPRDGRAHQALADVGFTIPASGSTYWVGEAMGLVDYKDLDPKPAKVHSQNAMVARHAAHLARLLKSGSTAEELGLSGRLTAASQTRSILASGCSTRRFEARSQRSTLSHSTRRARPATARSARANSAGRVTPPCT
jgi:hypothetical protein